MSSDRYYLTSDDIRQQQRINRAVAELVDPAPVVNRRRNLSAGNTAPAGSPHPFDVELVNSGTDENPAYSVRVYDSTAPDSDYAGIVYLGRSTFSVPAAAVLPPDTPVYFYIYLLIQYDPEADPADRYSFSFVTSGDAAIQDGNQTARIAIAYGKLPDIKSRQSDDIHITDRWV